jgi:cell division protein FtsL
VFLSAIALIDARHQNRVLFEQLDQLHQQRDQLNVDWGRLLLEQSTWSTHAYIEQSATQKLDMGLPANPQVVVVKP